MRIIIIVVSLLFSTFVFAKSYGYDSNNIKSYLTEEDVVNSLKLLPAPPDKQSSDFARDKAIYKDTRKLNNTDRWKQAILDADYSTENILEIFSKEMGNITLNKEQTPAIYKLIQYIQIDAGYWATRHAKDFYKRERPFMMFNDSTCYPVEDENLRKDGSYPSGHTAMGWATALVLVEIAPKYQGDILKRGYEYGQSRVICGAHWQSDVDAGRVVSSAVVATLHNNKQFISDLSAAKKEFVKISKTK